MAVKIVTFWQGRISWLERLSLASMLAAGHSVELYTHDAGALRTSLGEMGRAIDIFDAREIVPDNPVIKLYFDTGYLSLYSDIFRLALLKHKRGVWADADCVFLRELMVDGDYLMGWSHPGSRVNNAVLYIRADAPLLSDYWSAITTSPMRAPWATNHIWLKRELSILLGRPMPKNPQTMSIGPRALTYFVRKHHLEGCVSAKERFYPFDQENVALLFDPDTAAAEARITPGTDIVHVWHSALGVRGLSRHERPVAGSWLDGCYKRLLG